MTRDPLQGAGPGRATEVRCRHCQDRVFIVCASREEALKFIALHLAEEHPELPNVLLEGQDLLVGPAPYRCDLCLSVAEPPWWTYTTGSSPAFSAQDPEWLVCDTCHKLIVTHDKPLRVLTERSLQVQMAEFILETIPTAELVASVKKSIRNFLTHRVGEPVRDSDVHGSDR